MIHPTAIVHPSARIDPSTSVGPYCNIGEEVEIGPDCLLMGNVFIEGPIRMGANNRFFPNSVIGVAPQDLKYQGERSETRIGAGNTFREFVTVHRGTKGGGGLTSIGDGCLLQAFAHVAHDCRIGSHVILGHGVTMAGHVTIEDHAFLGAFTGIHQHCRVGRHSIVGGYSVITQDVLPFSKTVAERQVKTFGVNKIGLERQGFSSERIERLHHAFRLLTASRLNTTQALEKIRAESLNEDLQILVDFITSSERGVIK
jgi:UDP-N-acetylglucosamine acyltransferase